MKKKIALGTDLLMAFSLSLVLKLHCIAGYWDLLPCSAAWLFEFDANRSFERDERDIIG